MSFKYLIRLYKFNPLLTIFELPSLILDCTLVSNSKLVSAVLTLKSEVDILLISSNFKCSAGFNPSAGINSSSWTSISKDWTVSVTGNLTIFVITSSATLSSPTTCRACIKWHQQGFTFLCNHVVNISRHFSSARLLSVSIAAMSSWIPSTAAISFQ